MCIFIRSGLPASVSGNAAMPKTAPSPGRFNGRLCPGGPLVQSGLSIASSTLAMTAQNECAGHSRCELAELLDGETAL